MDAWLINSWVNNREAGEAGHYDVKVMLTAVEVKARKTKQLPIHGLTSIGST